MRILVPLFLVVSLSLFAQEAPKGRGRGKMPPPKNLQVLTPQTLMPAMRSFTQALGVQCSFCHVQGDFSSDQKETKKTARMMLKMVRKINADNWTDGKRHVACYTCHRGAEMPLTEPPAAQ